MNKSTKHSDSESLETESQIRDQEILTLTVINSFAKDLLKVNSKQDIAWAITKNAINKLGFDDCIVYLVDDTEQTLIQCAAHGSKNPSGYIINNLISIPIGKGIVGAAAASGKSELVSDTSLDSRYIQDDEIRLSELAVPIILENQVLGVIDSEHSQRGFFTEYHLNILETIASMVSSRLGHIKIHEELEKHKNELVELVQHKTKNLRDTVSLLKMSNREITGFNYAIAHDLREPLRTICSFSELVLNRSQSLTDKNQEYLQRVVDCAKNMDHMLAGLLAVSSVDLTKLEKCSVDLNLVLKKVKKNLSFDLENIAHDISSISLPTIRGYESLLIQLFQNILSNSIKYRQKQQKLVININYEEKEGVIEISISDNGIGYMSSETKDPFQLFSRLNNAVEYEGTGLGLSMCKRIVLLHDGMISMTSDGFNKGTQVVFNLHK